MNFKKEAKVRVFRWKVHFFIRDGRWIGDYTLLQKLRRVLLYLLVLAVVV